MRKRRMRTPAIRLAACAAIGAVVTVGVAWCSVLWTAWNHMQVTEDLPSGSWASKETSNWPAPDYRAVRHGFGLSLLIVAAVSRDSAGTTYFREERQSAGLPAPSMGSLVSCWADLRSRPFAVTQVRTTLASQGFPLRWSDWKRLPLRPLWPGFALDTALYAAIALTLWSTPAAIRRHRRQARGHCSACGYDLKGAPTTTCPECGA